MNTTENLKDKTLGRCLKLPVAFNPARRLFVLSIIGLLAASATFRAHALPIKNGGFETGDLTGWGTWSHYAVTDSEAYAGHYCLTLGYYDTAYQKLSPAKVFGVLSFKAKAPNDGYVGYVDAVVVYSDGTSDKFFFGGGNLLSGAWESFEFSLHNKPITMVFFESGHDTLYIDNVALRD